MNAYLFSTLATVSRWGENKSAYGPEEGWVTWVSNSNFTVLGETPEEVQSSIEASMKLSSNTEHPDQVDIIRISGAQFVECLLTETGDEPINWPETCKVVQRRLEVADPNDFEPGYWVDVNLVVRPGEVSESLDALRTAVPEDIASGLNWAPEKLFHFVVTVFSSPESGAAETPASEEERIDSGGEPVYGPEAQTLADLYRTHPLSRDKETAALVLARNSVVAAWLWRRYARNTRLAGNEIRIAPWLPVWP